MEPAQPLYNQSATHFKLRLFIRPDAEVDGRLAIELADRFVADLLFPGVRLTLLYTKRAGEGAKMNEGEYSERRWTTTLRKLRANELAVVWLWAQTPDFPNQKIWLSIHVNPPGGNEHLVAQTVEVSCSVSYLRHLATSPEKVEALLKLATIAWNGSGRPAYGFGNLAISPNRMTIVDWASIPFATPLITAPAERVHPIPVAQVGEIDLNLERLYANGDGIKGAFWANFLTAEHLALAGGESALRERLPDMRITPLEHGGLLVLATDTPMPEDTEHNRRRFLQLDAALKPAFLSREATPERMRPMLGYFYRERP